MIPSEKIVSNKTASLVKAKEEKTVKDLQTAERPTLDTDSNVNYAKVEESTEHMKANPVETHTYVVANTSGI